MTPARDAGPAAGPDALPEPALVVLVGAAGSGKSTWAAHRYRPAEVVSSDALRAVVGSGPADLDASQDAFDILDRVVAARLRRGLTVVVDTLGLDPARRRGHLDLARAAGLAAVAVVLDTDARTCRTRNAARDRAVPAAVLSAQLRRARAASAELAQEGWDRVVTVSGTPPAAEGTPRTVTGTPPPVEGAPRKATGTAVPAAGRAPAPTTEPLVFLQVSRFPWGQDPAGWLRSVAGTAYEVGFGGLALMDHLIQIPQVGRAWDPIPQPWVTLGFLAGLDTGLRLGTLVSPLTFHLPGVLAKTVATLDVLSGGRAFCGVGAGWWAREHEAFGLELPSAGERLDALEGGIETLRALWAPGTKAVARPRVRLPETTCYPRPIGRVPIIVGGSGERRTLRIAAELADACNVPSDEEALPRRVAVLREHCARAGRDPAEVEVTVLDVPVIGTSREDTARRVERLRGRTPAALYAARHHAAQAPAHAARYRRLAALGVTTVFLSLPDLESPDDLERCRPLLAALT